MDKSHPLAAVFSITVPIALVVLGLWMYAPALTLPPSLMDEVSMLNNLDRWQTDISQHGLRGAVQRDMSVDQKIYNLGFWVFGPLKYFTTGGQPFHWWRLGELALVSLLLFRSICLAALSRMTGFAGATLAVALFLLAEVPGGVDSQGLRINWYRLFTSDADALFYLSIFVFSLLAVSADAIRGRCTRAVLFGVLAILGGCMAFTMKLPFSGVVVGSTVAAGIAALFCRERRLGFGLFGVGGLVAVLFIIYNVILRRLHIETPGATYADSFSFSLENLKSGMTGYRLRYWNIFGPLLPAVAALIPWSAVVLWKGRLHRHKLLFISFVFFVSFTVASVALYLPWNTHLPRYMLTGVFGLVATTGVVMTVAFQELSRIWRTRPLWLLLIIAGVVATLLPVWILVLVVSTAGVLCFLRLRHAAVPFLTGPVLTACLYMLVISPAVRSGAEHVYMNYEKAGWEATMALLRYSAQGRNVCFVGNVRNEMAGSMAGHVYRMGVEPRLFGSDDAANCGPGSVVIRPQWASPAEDVAKATAGRRIVAQYGATSVEFPVPVSFWTFRERLFDGRQPNKSIDYWRTPYMWRFYE